MPLAAIRRYSFEERIRRAQALAVIWLSAAEVLETCQRVLEFQWSLRQLIEGQAFNVADRQSRLPLQVDLLVLLPLFQDFLQMMDGAGAPAALAQAAQMLNVGGPASWEESLRRYWADSSRSNQNAESFFLHAFLQPLAEHLAEKSEVSLANYAGRKCPYCGRKPACGVLRPEGDGAKRSLICSFCSTEWEYRRIVCPTCEQEDVDRLPVYTAEAFPLIRIEACDVCQTFIKTIDLTKDGRAIPIIDEIGSVPLTLWAEEKGYRKLEHNLLLM